MFPVSHDSCILLYCNLVCYTLKVWDCHNFGSNLQIFLSGTLFFNFDAYKMGQLFELIKNFILTFLLSRNVFSFQMKLRILKYIDALRIRTQCMCEFMHQFRKFFLVLNLFFHPIFYYLPRKSQWTVFLVCKELNSPIVFQLLK